MTRVASVPGAGGACEPDATAEERAAEPAPPGSLAGFAPRQITKEGWVYDKHRNRDD